MGKKLGTWGIAAAMVAMLFWGYRYIHYRSLNAVSDAAFIKSDRLVMLSFKLPGKVVTMQKEANDPVRKGEVLARLDTSELEAAKAEAEHKRDALKKRIDEAVLKRRRLQKSLALQSAITTDDIARLEARIKAETLRIEAAEAQLEKLRRDTARYASLVKARLIAPDIYEKADTQRRALARDIEAMQKGLDAVRIERDKAQKALALSKLNEAQITELDKTIEAMQEEYKALEKALEGIAIKLDESVLYAPFNGTVAKKFTDAPRVVDAGTPVYAVVDPGALYCEVLLSEKKLHGVRPGNAVRIEVDAIKDKTYEGVVSSLSPVSASTFSLVPRDIASGEFTKLDQRFAVRIELKDKEGLRAGMGATVAIERKE